MLCKCSGNVLIGYIYLCLNWYFGDVSGELLLFYLHYWIVVVVELCCLDEGRSLYSVDCLVATTGIRIIL